MEELTHFSFGPIAVGSYEDLLCTALGRDSTQGSDVSLPEG